MGLADRDYMRDRHRRTKEEQLFGPPQQPKTPLLGILLYSLVAGFVLVKMIGWYQESRAVTRHAPATASRGPLAPEGNVQAEQKLLPVTPSDQPTLRQNKVRRCERDGKVLYSDQDCERAIAMRPPVPLPDDPPPTTSLPVESQNQIYLCKAYDGGMFWSSAHCNQQRAHIERIAPVPPGLPFDQQVAIAQQQRNEARSAIESARAVPVQSTQGPSDLKARCAALDQAIGAIDARARQPLPGFEQDRLAAERRRLRDQQFRIRCA